MKALGLLLGAGVAALASGQAGATVTLYAQTAGTNGGAITSLGSDPGSGSATYSGTYGTFFNTLNGIGAPLNPSPTLISNTLNVSTTAGGTISLFVSQSGVTGTPTNLISSFTANDFTGSVTSVTESTYVSATDPFKASATGGYTFSAQPLYSYKFTAQGKERETDSVAGIKGPYYEVARYDVTFGAAGSSANNTINIQAGTGAVPELASWAMMLAGFGLMGVTLRQRRRAAVSFA